MRQQSIHPNWYNKHRLRILETGIVDGELPKATKMDYCCRVWLFKIMRPSIYTRLAFLQHHPTFVPSTLRRNSRCFSLSSPSRRLSRHNPTQMVASSDLDAPRLSLIASIRKFQGIQGIDEKNDLIHLTPVSLILVRTRLHISIRYVLHNTQT